MFMQMKSRQEFRRSRPRTNEELAAQRRRDLIALGLTVLVFLTIFGIAVTLGPR